MTSDEKTEFEFSIEKLRMEMRELERLIEKMEDQRNFISMKVANYESQVLKIVPIK